MSDDTPPIHRLPPETLGDIFSLVAQEGIDLVDRVLPSPWTLSLVCKPWRDFVFDSPQLWASIRIHLDRVGAHDLSALSHTVVNALEVCLERSRECPLTFSLRANTAESRVLFPSLVTACLRHAYHWEDFALNVPIDRLLPSLSDPKHCYPRLKSLFLRGPGFFQASESPPEAELFKQAPLLRKLQLHDFPYRLQDLKLPWFQITDFSSFSNAGTMSDLLNVLHEMPSLITLRFVGMYSRGEGVGTIRPLELPYLQRLAWSNFKHSHSVFFDSIRAPRLNELEFRCSNVEWNRCIDRFFDKSNCHVTILYQTSSRASVTVSLLNILPGIETLVFCSTSLERELIRDLTFDDSKPHWLGSRIRRIVLQNVEVPEEAQDEYVSMIESRLRVPEDLDPRGCRLESLHVTVKTNPRLPAEFYSTYQVAFTLLEERLSPQYMVSLTFEKSWDS